MHGFSHIHLVKKIYYIRTHNGLKLKGVSKCLKFTAHFNSKCHRNKNILKLEIKTKVKSIGRLFSKFNVLIKRKCKQKQIGNDVSIGTSMFVRFPFRDLLIHNYTSSFLHSISYLLCIVWWCNHNSCSSCNPYMVSMLDIYCDI